MYDCSKVALIRPRPLRFLHLVATLFATCLAMLASGAMAQTVVPQDGIITTLVGNGAVGYQGDGGPASSASLNYPGGLAVDSAGNIYIADWGNNVVRMVSAATGTISTVVGNGTQGYTGDGSTAIAAELNGPVDVALDSAGNLYILESKNNTVRMVSASGGISTIVGNGSSGYSGDGGPATSAQLNNPSAIALDSSGNIYIADSSNAVIREVIASTGIITTVAGNGNGAYSGDGGPATAASLNFPDAVALDSANNLYIVDYFDNTVRKVTASTGIIATVAGNGTQNFAGDEGPATSAQLYGAGGVAVDALGNIYIADSGNNVIRMVTASTGIITTIAGGGEVAGYSGDGSLAVTALMNSPISLKLLPQPGSYYSSPNIYAIDSGNNVIRTVGGYRTAAPRFSPVSATYSTPQSVTITDAVPGATIYYTTDGTTPTISSTVYSGPVSVNGSETLNAIAVTPAGLLTRVGTAPYTITNTAATADFSSGFTSSGLSLVNAPIVNGTLQFSDGNLEEARAAWFTTPVSARAFTSDFNYQILTPAQADGITLTLQNDPAGVNAIGANGEGLAYQGLQSSVAIKYDFWNNLGEGIDSTGFYINGASPAVPSIDMTGSDLQLRSGDLLHIHATYDGTTLTSTISDTVTKASFTASTAIDIPSIVGGDTAYVGLTGATGGFTSIQYLSNWTYISGSATTFAAAPSFSPPSGSYTSAQSVTISDATSGATLYYTTNGTAPTVASSVYSGPIAISASETVQAIAVAPAFLNSQVSSATYTITSGNQPPQPDLTITSPATGTIAVPGETIAIAVSSVSNATYTGVALVGEGPVGFGNTQSAVPAQFSLTIPANTALGKYQLSAVGVTSDDQTIWSAPILIDVERQDSPISLTAIPSNLQMRELGVSTPVSIMGTFSDGSLLDVTNSGYISYTTTNPTVFTVGSDGLVTPKTPGYGNLHAIYSNNDQSVLASAGITVALGPLSPSSSSLFFPQQAIGTPGSPQSISLTNSTQSLLSIVSIAISGSYQESDNCSQNSTLGPGAGCTITVTFVPTSIGPNTGSLKISNNFSSNSISIPLAGTGN